MSLRNSLSRSGATRAAKIDKGRLEFLDVFRGLAALAVVFEHACERAFPGYLQWANNHFTLGVFGVVCFFLVSGFIIPVSIERHDSLMKFWEARFFRLYPIYWFSIIFAVALGLAGIWPLPPMFHLHPVKVIAANVTMFQTFLNIPNLMQGYWTLSLELAFYLLCSILFLSSLLSRTVLWAWAAVIANLLLNMGFGLGLHRSLPAGQMGMLTTAFFGTLVYRVYKGQVNSSAIWRLAPVMAVSLAVGFWFRLVRFPGSLSDERFTFAGVIASNCGAYLLFAVLYTLRNRRFPGPFLWLGRISYSLYLLQGFVLILVPPKSLVWMLIGITGSVVLSGLTFRYIEQPLIAFHRRRTKGRASANVSVNQPTLAQKTITRANILVGLAECLGMFGALRLILSAYFASRPGDLIPVTVRNLTNPILLRARTTDIHVFFQIFALREYSIDGFVQSSFVTSKYEDLLRSGRTPVIIDCGANTGLSAIWFASCFPKARIFAIEPSASNYRMLQSNVAAFSGHITPIEAAIWDTKSQVQLENPTAAAWSFRMEPASSRSTSTDPPSEPQFIDTVTINQLLVETAPSDLMIVKIDIEGGEKYLFRSNTEWLRFASLVVIEIHDQLQPYARTGTNFVRAIADATFELCFKGENMFVFFDTIERDVDHAHLSLPSAAS